MARAAWAPSPSPILQPTSEPKNFVETTLAEPPQSALSGVARMLVHAGKLQAKVAEDLVRQSREKKVSFVNSVIAAGVVSSVDLAHTLSTALALPVLDLNAMDVQRMPQNIIDSKLAQQYQVVVLGRRGSRLFIGGADPTDQEGVGGIKFATQLAPEWVIVEHDKLSKLLQGAGSSASEMLESMAGGDFDFDIAEEDAAPQQGGAELAAVEGGAG